MTALAYAVIVLGAAVLVLGIRDWHRREIKRAMERHPAGRRRPANHDWS